MSNWSRTVSRWGVLGRACRGPLARYAFAAASVGALIACSSNSSNGGNDAGTQPDATADVTSGGGNDSGTQDTGAEAAATDGYTYVSMGDAGEPCNPDGSCAPGLFCTGGTCSTSPACQGKPMRALPYNIASDFDTLFTIGPESINLNIIPSGAECDATTYPSAPNTGLGDAAVPEYDAGDAGYLPVYPALTDGGVETVSYSKQPSCYEMLFDPSCETGGQGLCWAGAVFTNSAATAAAAPGAVVTPAAVGVCLAPGATVISFWARASVPGVVVKFGSSRPGQCLLPLHSADGGPPDPATEQTTCPGDTEFYIGITTEWQNYTISLAAGEPYDDEPGGGGGVWNAFSMVLEPQYFVGGAYVFVKDIVWSNPAAGYDAGVVMSTGSEAGTSEAGTEGGSASDAHSD